MTEKKLTASRILFNKIGEVENSIENIDNRSISNFENPLIRELALQELEAKLAALKKQFEEL